MYVCKRRRWLGVLASPMAGSVDQSLGCITRGAVHHSVKEIAYGPTRKPLAALRDLRLKMESSSRTTHMQADA